MSYIRALLATTGVPKDRSLYVSAYDWLIAHHYADEIDLGRLRDPSEPFQFTVGSAIEKRYQGGWTAFVQDSLFLSKGQQR